MLVEDNLVFNYICTADYDKIKFSKQLRSKRIQEKENLANKTFILEGKLPKELL